MKDMIIDDKYIVVEYREDSDTLVLDLVGSDEETEINVRLHDHNRVVAGDELVFTRHGFRNMTFPRDNNCYINGYRSK